jgi:hypothetical protein
MRRSLWPLAGIGLPEVPFPKGNPQVPAKIALGDKLFHDARFSTTGEVIPLREMINGCIQQPLQGKPLTLDDPKMVALEVSVSWERRGVLMAPGKH